MDQLAREVLDYINRPGYRPQRVKSLAKNLGVAKKGQPEFEQVLDDLRQRGRLRISEGGRVQPAAPANTVIGIVRKIASGAAFLVPHEPRPREVEGDIFIEAHDLKDAQNGDEAAVKLLSRRRSGGGQCGIVTDVVERATNVFVGTYFEEDDAGWVEIDGRDFADPIYVGDAGAKGAANGDKVVIEMLRFPTHRNPGEAVLTKVLGPRGEVGVDTQMIIHEFGLPQQFSEAVLDDARLEAENFNEEDFDGREDLTGETILTIDPVDARDFDDAISLLHDERGHWLLGVHIADVSAFVRPGSALDDEAKLRGTSVYLPTQVIPMLPEVISNGLASLQERRVRYTKSVFIEYTPEGIPVSTRFANTVIKTARRFAYEEVMPIINGSEKHRGKVPAAIRKLLAEMYELAMILRRRRIARGYLELSMPEVDLDFDANHRVIGAHEEVHDESHQMIEEFMLAANIAVAKELSSRGIGFLRRVHGEPSPVKLKQLKDLVEALGLELERPESRRDLQRLLKEVAGSPADRTISYGVLRSMKRAEYSALPQGHYALSEDDYCHFTSPIRRYPDLTVHRLFDVLLAGKRSGNNPSGDELLQLARHCSNTERRAADAERELTKLKLLTYFEDRIGEELEGVITGVDRYGFFVRGTVIPAEGLVHMTSLSQQDHFDYDRGSLSLTGRRSGKVYRLGDRVMVAVANVDVDRRQLDLRLVRWISGGLPGSTGRSGKRGNVKSRGRGETGRGGAKDQQRGGRRDDGKRRGRSR
jgi:ribonuclease R